MNINTQFEISRECTSENALIYHELAKVGRPDHERITFLPNGKPTTTKKSWWLGRIIQWFYKFPDQRLHAVVAKTLQFFENNQDFSEARNHCLKMLEPLIYKTKSNELLNLYHNLLRPLNQRLDDFVRGNIASLEKQYKAKNIELSNKFDVKSKKLNDKLDKIKNEILEGEKIFKLLEVKMANTNDTELSGTDGSISISWSVLQNSGIAFFTSLQEERVSHLNDKQFSISFKKYSKKSLTLFHYFILNNSLPTIVLYPLEDMINLYSFAKEIQFSLFQTYLLKKFEEILTPYFASFILSSKHFIGDPLSKLAQKIIEPKYFFEDEKKSNQSAIRNPHYHFGIPTKNIHSLQHTTVYGSYKNLLVSLYFGINFVNVDIKFLKNGEK